MPVGVRPSYLSAHYETVIQKVIAIEERRMLVIEYVHLYAS